MSTSYILICLDLSKSKYRSSNQLSWLRGNEIVGCKYPCNHFGLCVKIRTKRNVKFTTFNIRSSSVSLTNFIYLDSIYKRLYVHDCPSDVAATSEMTKRSAKRPNKTNALEAIFKLFIIFCCMEKWWMKCYNVCHLFKENEAEQMRKVKWL